MVLKFQLNPQPSILEDYTVKIFEASNSSPGAEVMTINVPQPHNIVQTVIANGLDKVVHVVRTYTAITAALINDYNVEPVADTVTIFDPIRFKIGDGALLTPVAGTASYTDPILVGLQKEDYSVFRNNYGELFPDVHYTVDPVTGTFALAGGDLFNDQEEFIIRRKFKMGIIVNDSVVGKWFGGFVDIAANTNYIAGHLRKLIRFSGTCQYTFLGAIPIGYAFVFQHFGVLGIGTINFTNAPLKWGAVTKASIDIPDYCEACFVFDGAFWNVVYISQSTFVNAGAVPPGQTIAVGTFAVGDVSVGDPVFNIVHNLNIAGDYMVMYSIKSNNTTSYIQNNRVTGTWWHDAVDKPNKFHVSLQELGPETQNLSISWMIIKT